MSDGLNDNCCEDDNCNKCYWKKQKIDSLKKEQKQANEFIIDIAKLLKMDTDGIRFDELSFSIEDFETAINAINKTYDDKNSSNSEYMEELETQMQGQTLPIVAPESKPSYAVTFFKWVIDNYISSINGWIKPMQNQYTKGKSIEKLYKEFENDLTLIEPNSYSFSCTLDGGMDNCDYNSKDAIACLVLRKCKWAKYDIIP